MEKCCVCKCIFSIVVEDMKTNASFCPICGAVQSKSDTTRTGMLRIGSHIWRVHIHPEFRTSDIEFRDGAGNTLVIMRNVGL